MRGSEDAEWTGQSGLSGIQSPQLAANFRKVEDSGSLSLSYLTLSDKVWSGCYHFLCSEEETETSVIGGRY